MKSEQEVELIDYLRVLWRQKWVIAVTFIVAVVAAWGASRAIGPTYQSEASLLLLPPLASELGAESAGSILQPDAYETFARSTEILRSIVVQAELADSISLVQLRNRLSVSLDPLIISEDRYARIGDQVVLTLACAWPDPQEAAAIVDAWIHAFEEGFAKVFLDRTTLSANYLQENLDQAEVRLAGVIEQRTNLLSDTPLDVMREEVAALLEGYSSDVARLLQIRRQLEASRSSLIALETELSMREPSHVLRKSLDPEALLAAVVSGLSARDYQALVATEAEEQVINETYFSLDESVARERVQIATLEAELAYTEESVSAAYEELALKQREILLAEAELEELDAQVELLRSSRSQLAASLLNAQIALAETLSPVRVIDEPFVPQQSIAPKKATNIAVAGFLGLILGTLFAFLVDYLARVREEEGAARESTKEAGPSDPLRHEESDQKAQTRGGKDSNHTLS